MGIERGAWARREARTVGQRVDEADEATVLCGRLATRRRARGGLRARRWRRRRHARDGRIRGGARRADTVAQHATEVDQEGDVTKLAKVGRGADVVARAVCARRCERGPSCRCGARPTAARRGQERGSWGGGAQRRCCEARRVASCTCRAAGGDCGGQHCTARRVRAQCALSRARFTGTGAGGAHSSTAAAWRRAGWRRQTRPESRHTESCSPSSLGTGWRAVRRAARREAARPLRR
jgi:hypothetical protein